MTLMALSRIHFPVTTLGAGRRVGIWFQGCSIRCAGCISVDTWAKKTADISVSELVAQIEPWLMACDGITISGGEPFDQVNALLALVAGLKQKTAKSILVFSGYDFETIQPLMRQADHGIDALVTGPYKLNHGQTMVLRGSDNQQLHLITPLGRKEFSCFERKRNKQDLKLDMMYDADGSIWFAGIPEHNDFQKLRTLLATQGHQAFISVAPLESKKKDEK